MILGCRNPNAVNYNPLADTEDNSCIYLIPNGATCNKFTDFTNVVDNSFTLSYAIAGGSWVFFHDYQPDMYIHTRENLYSSSNSTLYKHHEGPPGAYYGSTQPFFIDIVFRAEGDLLLEAVNWTTEFLDGASSEQSFETLTHISIWNSRQHTGRIPLSQVFSDLQFGVRRTKGSWNFNDFRDILLANSVQFLLDLFHNYALDTNQVDASSGWYDRALLQDKWFCVRFEFDNLSGRKVILHDTTITALKSDR